ncbi:hypothetical protein BZA77DRAFT_359863 [Pyronema omphalodes]|nr:hypothetical protein BZA77DRAFT_359863 [Pyronema omphalodes]
MTAQKSLPFRGNISSISLLSLSQVSEASNITSIADSTLSLASILSSGNLSKNAPKDDKAYSLNLWLAQQKQDESTRYYGN